MFFHLVAKPKQSVACAPRENLRNQRTDIMLQYDSLFSKLFSQNDRPTANLGPFQLEMHPLTVTSSDIVHSLSIEMKFKGTKKKRV